MTIPAPFTDFQRSLVDATVTALKSSYGPIRHCCSHDGEPLALNVLLVSPVNAPDTFKTLSTIIAEARKGIAISPHTGETGEQTEAAMPAIILDIIRRHNKNFPETFPASRENFSGAAGHPLLPVGTRFVISDATLGLRYAFQIAAQIPGTDESLPGYRLARQDLTPNSVPPEPFTRSLNATDPYAVIIPGLKSRTTATGFASPSP